MKIFDAPNRRSVLTGAAALAAGGLASGPAFAKAPMLNTQVPAFYRFKLGGFEGTVVSDGPLHFGPPTGEVFPGLTKEEMQRGLDYYFLPADMVSLEQNTLVLNTGNQLVLFDTGLGAFKMMGDDSGRLVQNLKTAGIDPKDIDAVVLTHAHPDHCFGLMANAETRNFPNAQIYMSQADLEFWTDEGKGSDPMLRGLILGARLQLLPHRDRIVFFKDGQEFLPGIQAIATPGHTVGHFSFIITSQGRSFCNTGDIVHHHVVAVERPRLAFSFDTDGQQAVQSRLRMLDMLSASRMPILAYHFPWPGIGHFGKQGDAYRYVPSPMRMVL